MQAKTKFPAVYLFIFIILAWLQQTYAQEYIIKNYNVVDGLAQSTVRDIFQDSTGFLWIGTERGLSRFDGSEFVNYKTGQDLFRAGIYKIKQDRNRDLLIINTNGELWKFDGVQFNKHPLHNIKELRISDLWLLDNALLVSTFTDGCYLFEGDSLKHFSREEGLYSNYVHGLSGSSEEIYIMTNGGINLFKNKKVEPLFKNNGLKFYSILKDSKDIYWCSAINKGLFRFVNKKWVCEYSDPGNMIYQLKQDAKGCIWIAGSMGLKRLVENSLGEINIFDELEATQVRRVFTDRENNIWCGTLGRGLYKLRKNLFENMGTPGFSPPGFARIILRDSHNRIWIAMVNRGLIMFDGQKFNRFNETDGLLSPDVTNAAETADGKILITAGNNIYEYTDGRIKVFDRKNLPDGRIYVLYSDSQNRLWASITRNGVWKFEDDKWEQLDLLPGEKPYSVVYFFEDSRGVIWFSASGYGLINYKDENFKFISENDGLMDNRLYAVSEDKEGNIWAATEAGINLIKNNTVTDTLRDSEGIIDKAVFTITPYEDKMIFGTSDGLGIYDEGRVKYFTNYDGLNSNDISAYDAVVDNKRGKIWFGTSDGVTIFDIENYFSQKYFNRAYVSRVITDSDTINYNFLQGYNTFTVPELSSELDYIYLDFNTISFTKEIKNYRYKLAGPDKNDSWKYSENNRLTIEEPEAGNYSLEIETKTFGENWKRAYTVSLIIYDPFYKNAYFRISIFALLLISIAGYYYYSKQKKKKNKYKTSSVSEEQLTEIRARLAKLMETEKIFIDPDTNLQSVAEELKVSKEHISRAINSGFGMNFNDYINSHRINEACKMLEEKQTNNAPVIQIAFSVGFNSKSSFNTAFKKFTGFTPTGYKKSKLADSK